jgi:hypothetical protein
LNRTALFFLLLAAVSLTSLACNPKKTSRTSSENGAERIEESDAAAEQLIQSVVNMLRGLPARNMYPTVAMQLNQYFARQGDNIRPLDQDVRQAAVTMLGPQALTELERELTVIDIDFLVSSLFFQTVNRILRSETYDELAYAEKLFEWVTRNVQVVPPGSLPMGTPMEVCIRGMASGQERAWIFLELLRQADLPGCVVAVAREDQPDNPIPWFCGVIINDEVHLFHPELGIPIPSAKNRIATLSEVAGDPEILKQLEQDLKSDYKVAPPENRYSLLVVIETPMLSPKMEFLQSRLTGEYRTNL